jgi:hypothetical protein
MADPVPASPHESAQSDKRDRHDYEPARRPEHRFAVDLSNRDECDPSQELEHVSSPSNRFEIHGQYGQQARDDGRDQTRPTHQTQNAPQGSIAGMDSHGAEGLIPDSVALRMRREPIARVGPESTGGGVNGLVRSQRTGTVCRNGR